MGQILYSITDPRSELLEAGDRAAQRAGGSNINKRDAKAESARADAYRHAAEILDAAERTALEGHAVPWRAWHQVPRRASRATS